MHNNGFIINFIKSSIEDTGILSLRNTVEISRFTSEIENFIYDFIKPSDAKIFNTRDISLIENLDKGTNLINLKKVNDIRWINKFFNGVNEKLEDDGIFIGCVETYKQRKERIYRKYPLYIAVPFYALSFIYRRILPKFSPTKKIYFNLTGGYDRVISKAEILGRLVSCGFEILELKEINNLLYFACRKFKDPSYDNNPSYGLILKLKRIGTNGKIINVYKIRTMHPYAEYLQEYIFRKNNLDEGGKFKDDFRITNWGKIFRRFWLDEIPMLYNWIKRDIKLVGCRPLSNHYLSLYSNELKEKRLKFKPGLLPPFYYDLPKTLEEIMSSEMKYLTSYEKNPLKTDIKYFFVILFNILFRNVRSK